ncbi:hypothetical protein JHN55_25030 [Streptomyces sp. MBT56]|uniref:hypothetical protein n=1 Tax=unclassified Streptomyces TaxID=2593676 RepID=UPI00190D8752|nr:MULTISPECIES: hypothetical protein [unclassified Streptomyces]MBK3559729.1 hypothetical protein [Streptomyces sp. MBT56]MBK3604905.1 hypothetical protein [Streptomyces sp. MBT54]MBK3615307.1 hypothetical protein [Streptomyces sp. MBT98]
MDDISDRTPFRYAGNVVVDAALSDSRRARETAALLWGAQESGAPQQLLSAGLPPRGAR